MEIYFRGEKHKTGDYHYHMFVSDKIGQKKVFTRFMKRGKGFLPEGYGLCHINDSAITIRDKKEQLCYMTYHQYDFPLSTKFHNIHLFIADELIPIFTEALQKCFPKSTISWGD